MDTKTVIEQYPPRDDAERTALLEWIATVPLTHGAWKHFKGLYKRAEASVLNGTPADLAVLAALAARLDTAPLSAPTASVFPDLSNSDWLQGVAARDGYAFLSIGEHWAGRNRQFAVYDVSDPLRPTRVGSTKLNGVGRVLLSGNLAFIVPSRAPGQPPTLTVVDISEPRQPRATGTLNLGWFRDVAVSGEYLFVTTPRDPNSADRDLELQIWKVEPMGNAEKIGAIDINQAGSVAVAGDYVLVGAGPTGLSWNRLPKAGGLRIVDTRDPRSPKLVASLDLGDIQAISVAGQQAYVQTRAGSKIRYQTVDISDPKNPRKAGGIDLKERENTPANAYHRGHIYQAAGYFGLRVLDVSNPAAPREVGPLKNLPSVQSIAPLDDYLLVSCSYAGLQLVDVSEPASPARIGQSPSSNTMGYMKRRVRRLLRTLAERNDDTFVELAVQILQRAGHDRDALDLRNQWLAADLLLGDSRRYTQRSHGRGSYALTSPRFTLKTREERAPQAWDRRPDLALKLYESDALPWQVYETALKILRAAGTPAPPADKKRLSRFLVGTSPLLAATAVRTVVAALEAGAEIDAAVDARAYALAGGRHRRQIETRLPGHAVSESWSRTFASELFGFATTNLVAGRMSRRQTGAALLLAREFPTLVPRTQVRDFVAVLLAPERPELTAWAHDVIRDTAINEVPLVLDHLMILPNPTREPAIAALAEAVSDKAFDLNTARTLVTGYSRWRCEIGWRLLQASDTEHETLNKLWRELFSTEYKNVPLQVAFSSPHAFAVLERLGLDAAELATLLDDRPWLFELLSPEVFERTVEALPPALVVHLLANSPENTWATMRPHWLQSMRGERVAAIWRAAWSQLGVDANLANRLLHDPEASATFRAIDVAAISAFLQTDNPQLGPLLADWFALHEHRIERDDPLLLTAATHQLAEVRDWGLRRLRAFGLNLPLALRLLEAELPACVVMGREYFEAASPGSDEELDHALALCDSPRRLVRDIGREFIEQRSPTLSRELLRRRLFENPNPDIQAYVAALLLQEPEASPEFDAAVLRTRSRARRAKELVKRRMEQAAETTPDVATLLEMARSRTPRDAEWARVQLAQLALEGQEIEGVTVEGVVGI